MQTIIERVERAILALKNGEMIILTDHPDRENEGDLIMPAETINAEAMNFMIRNGTGIVCLSITEATLNQFDLSLMVPPGKNTCERSTQFTLSVDAKDGITTGVSASDRVCTVKALLNSHMSAADIITPGHIFPLLARKNGVLERRGHTEGSIDLVKLAGFKPLAVICEIMNPDGTMAKGEELTQFAEQHQLQTLSIDDIIHYRLLSETHIDGEASTIIPLDGLGEFEFTAILEKHKPNEHIVLSKKKKMNDDQPLLVRIHSACTTGDLFGSLRCDCQQQLHYSLQRINEEGGILIYLQQEGRGIGLVNKIKAYQLQDEGCDTLEANRRLGLANDLRQYYLAAHFLKKYNIKKIRLLTNNPHKLAEMKNYDIDVTHEELPTFSNMHNYEYLATKRDKLNHFINLRVD